MTVLDQRPTTADPNVDSSTDPVVEAHARIVSHYAGTPDYALYREGDMFRVGHPGAWILADMNDIPEAILTLAALDARATGLEERRTW